MTTTRDAVTRTELRGAPERRRRRWLVGVTAGLTALSSAFVAAPAQAAGTPPQITTVVSHGGGKTVTLGHPQVAATAKLSPQAVAYNPTNGDEAAAVVTATGQAHVYLIAGATEPNEYHIRTATPPAYGPLVKGDAYLMAGNGTFGQIANPGYFTVTTGGSTSAAAVTNPIAPLSLAFDGAGNLLMAGSHITTSIKTAGIQMVAKTTCSSSCSYGYSAFGAGNLYSLAGVGMRGLTRTPAIPFIFGVYGYGLAVDAQGNLIDGSNGEVVFVNEQATALTLYGRTLAAKEATAIGGTGTTGLGTCTSGGSALPATGSTLSPYLKKPHPYVDASDNVYLNDNQKTVGTGCVWVLPATSGSLDGMTVTAGNIYSLSGPSTATAYSSGAAANTTAFPNPSAVVTDPAGNVVVSLSGTNPAIRVIAESHGTFYDQTMTKGHVYTIAGAPTGTSTTTPGPAKTFKFAGTPVTYTGPIPYGITSLVNGAPGDVLLANGVTGSTGSVYQITRGPTMAPPAPPTVTMVSPNKGPASGGTLVTVTGTNFTATATVDFGTTPGTSVTVKSPTQLTVVDPAGTGTVAVSVTDTDGTGQLAAAFTYVEKPTVTKVSPTSGPAKGGTTVTVTGTNFTTVTAVDFGTKPGTTVHVTDATTLTVVNPSGTGKVPVSVTAAGGIGMKTTAFTYLPSPTVTKVSPDVGPLAGGTTVTVTGTNFTATATVDFGTNAGTTVHVTSSTKLTVVDPAGTGTVAVTVTTSVGTGTLPAAFTYVGPPTIISVTPEKGPEAGGTPVTITGTNLTTASKVEFGTTPGTSVHATGSTKVTVDTPAGSGTVDVTVTAAGGTFTATKAFTYVPKPTVTKVSPTSGPAKGGTTVTVTGTNFTTVTAVDFGTKPGTTVHVTDATTLTVVNPSGTGKVPVSVTAAGGIGMKTTAFTYLPSPTVTKVSPDVGPLAGGTTVTVTGTNFTATATVDFGTNAGTTVHVTSSTKLTVVDPAGTGTVAVTVTTSVGTGTLPAAFTYVGPPTVTMVSPNKGPVAGGTTVTITGTNFTTTSTVHFGFALGTTVHVTNATTLTVVDPAGTSGPVSVTVTALGGRGTLPSAFTYVAAPTVAKVSPTSGPAQGGTTVTVTGTNFTTVTAVDFGTTPGTSVTVKSSTQLTVVDPAGSGTVAVLVTAAGGTGKLTGAFSYTATPTPPPPSTKGKGYWEVASDGGLFAFGAAQFYGSMGGMPLNKPIVGMTATPTGKGYWEVASDGGLFAFGAAQFYGSMGGMPLNAPIVGMTATPTGKGYWEVASDGGLFAFGAAQFYGSMGGMPLNKPIVGMTATPTGKGYWEVASDGGLFAFGAAQFYGSMGGMPLNKPIAGMTATPTGKGYWEVASDGGIFAFGAAQFYGSMGGMPLNKPIAGMTATPTGKGYWEVASDGGIFAFGAAQFYGSMGGMPLNAPIVGIGVVDST